ncbi:hypothetical protein V3C99_009435, partial [Haemonchus contortus]|uniref:GLOBIN domain-containing protein n=1 Tax=Haemonchus contortus TaxID=6289 RepID=A0A7I4YKW1_HAECO
LSPKLRMYRTMVNNLRNSLGKSIPEESKDKTELCELTQEPKGSAPTMDKAEGESDETVMAVRQQLSRLTERQHAVIIRTFAKMGSNPVKNALQVLLRLFAEYPQYKRIWPQFRGIQDSSLINAIELRRHASVYMCGLTAIIHSMNREDELEVQMKRIAKAHVKWNVHRSHVENMLDPALEVLKECNDDFDEEAKQAWSTLYDIIAEVIEIYRKKV